MPVASHPNAGTKGVPRAEREGQILDAATAVFGTDGFAGTSVSTIAEGAGISKPLIYNYFGSKEGLFTACLHRNGALLADEIERIARGGDVGPIRGLKTLEGIFAVLEDQPLMWRLFFDGTAPRTGDIAAALDTYTDRITGLAVDGVTEMMHIAGIRDEADISAMVAVWMGMVDSLVNWWLAHPDESATAMTQRCVRLVMALYAPGVMKR
jgi:AcrR family transcriptional regulator